MAINPPPANPRRRQWGLFPVFPVPRTIEQRRPTTQPQYPSGPAFDFISGEFVLDGAGRLIFDNGYETWARWCVKTILTERFTYMAYDRMHGVSLQRARQMRTRSQTEISIATTIRQALKRDRRTADVSDFTFEWSNGDELQVTCTITPTVGSRRPISVALDLGRAAR